MKLEKLERIWTVLPRQLLNAPLDKLGELEKDDVGVGPNDVLVAPSVFQSNLVTIPQEPDVPQWQAFLNLCTLIESFVLNDHLVVRVPTDGVDLVVNAIIATIATDFLLIPEDSFNDIVRFAVGLSSMGTSGDDPDKIYLFPEKTVREQRVAIDEKLAGNLIYETKRAEWEAAVTHLMHERISAVLGCGYLAGFSKGGLQYHEVVSDRMNTVQKLTPLYIYELIRKTLAAEVEQLRTAGWLGDLYVPPIALVVLQKCHDKARHLGEAMLDERERASRFRKWVREIRSELADASSIRKAAKLHGKLQQVFKEFSGPDACKSWKVTSWNGLLAAFPKLVWDGLSKESIDVKPLATFLAKRSLELIASLIQRRNYLYLLDIHSKVRNIENYAAVVRKVLHVTLSPSDIDSLKSIRP